VLVQQPSHKTSATFQPREREIVGTTYTWSNPSSEFNQSKASLKYGFFILFRDAF